MPTDVVKSIGTGGDYSTIQAWEDDTSSLSTPNNLVASDVRYIGELKNQLHTSGVLISGQTVDSAHYMMLRCVSGGSFADGGSAQALHYDTTKGATVYESGRASAQIRSTVDYTRLIGIQVRNGTPYGGQGCVRMEADNGLVDSCLLYSTTGGPALALTRSTHKAVNTLVEYSTAPTSHAVAGYGQLYGCTVVNSGTAGGTAFQSEYASAVVKNCAAFGFTTFSTNATAAGSDYNATDLASASTGTHNATSLTFASQFQSVTVDFRAVASGGLKVGTPDSTNTPDDVYGTTRDGTTPYVGAYEVSGGGPATYTATAAWTSGSTTLSAAGTFVAPTYHGVGAWTSGSTTLAATAAFTAPVYSGAVALTSGSTTLAAAGTVVNPTYHGAAAWTATATTFAATALFATAVYSGSAALASAPTTLVAAGTFVAPVYAGVGTWASGSSVFAAAGTFAGPTFSGAAALTTTATTLTAAATFAPGTKTGVAAWASGSTTFAAVATFVALPGTVPSPGGMLVAGTVYRAGAAAGSVYAAGCAAGEVL